MYRHSGNIRHAARGVALHWPCLVLLCSCFSCLSVYLSLFSFVYGLLLVVVCLLFGGMVSFTPPS